jgi:hypothetical protein
MRTARTASSVAVQASARVCGGPQRLWVSAYALQSHVGDVAAAGARVSKVAFIDSALWTWVAGMMRQSLGRVARGSGASYMLSPEVPGRRWAQWAVNRMWGHPRAAVGPVCIACGWSARKLTPS